MQPKQTFISYSRNNADFALKLALKLKEEGINLWIDQLDIPAGARWDIEIGNALEKAECLLVILSKNSVSSNNVLDEVSYALESNKKVIPVLTDDCVLPFRLKRLQYVDFTNNFDLAFSRLIKALKEAGNAEPADDEKEWPKESVLQNKAAINQDEIKMPKAESNVANGKKGKRKNAVIIIVTLIIIAAFAIGLKQMLGGNDKPAATVAATDSLKTTPAIKDTIKVAVNKTQAATAVKTNQQTTPQKMPEGPLRIASGKFVFHTGGNARERGDVFISIWQQGKNIWNKKVPAQSSWAANTDFSFDENINAEIKSTTAVVMKMQYCSPRGLDITWSGNVLFTLKRSDNSTIIYKKIFDLNTASGSGIPKCTEIQISRVGKIDN